MYGPQSSNGTAPKFYYSFKNGRYVVGAHGQDLFETDRVKQASDMTQALNKTFNDFSDPSPDRWLPGQREAALAGEPAYLPRETAAEKADREFGQPHFGHSYGGTEPDAA